MNPALRTGVLHGHAAQRHAPASSSTTAALLRRRSDDGRARFQTELACDVGDRLFVTLSWPDGDETLLVEVYAVHAGFVDVRGYTPINAEAAKEIAVRKVGHR